MAGPLPSERFGDGVDPISRKAWLPRLKHYGATQYGWCLCGVGLLAGRFKGSYEDCMSLSTRNVDELECQACLDKLVVMGISAEKRIIQLDQEAGAVDSRPVL